MTKNECEEQGEEDAVYYHDQAHSITFDYLVAPSNLRDLVGYNSPADTSSSQVTSHVAIGSTQSYRLGEEADTGGKVRGKGALGTAVALLSPAPQSSSLASTLLQQNRSQQKVCVCTVCTVV